jgi:hypothetical protein
MDTSLFLWYNLERRRCLMNCNVTIRRKRKGGDITMRKPKKRILKLVQDVKNIIGQSFVKAYDIGDDRIIVIVRDDKDMSELIDETADIGLDYGIKNGIMPLILFQSEKRGDKPREEGVLVG